MGAGKFLSAGPVPGPAVAEIQGPGPHGGNLLRAGQQLPSRLWYKGAGRGRGKIDHGVPHHQSRPRGAPPPRSPMCGRAGPPPGPPPPRAPDSGRPPARRMGRRRGPSGCGSCGGDRDSIRRPRKAVGAHGLPAVVRQQPQIGGMEGRRDPQALHQESGILNVVHVPVGQQNQPHILAQTGGQQLFPHSPPQPVSTSTLPRSPVSR